MMEYSSFSSPGRVQTFQPLREPVDDLYTFVDQSKFLQLLLDERLLECGRDNIRRFRTPPILHHGQSLRKIASKDERDATKDEVFACLAFDIAEGTVNRLEDLVISHWHLTT